MQRVVRHHTFDDVANDELEHDAARVVRPFKGLCHGGHMKDAIGVRIGQM